MDRSQSFSSIDVIVHFAFSFVAFISLIFPRAFSNRTCLLPAFSVVPLRAVDPALPPVCLAISRTATRKRNICQWGNGWAPVFPAISGTSLVPVNYAGERRSDDQTKLLGKKIFLLRLTRAIQVPVATLHLSVCPNARNYRRGL